MFIKESDKYKTLRSESYNYNFDKSNGYFERWGKTKEDDPNFSPFGPEILDIELSVNGCPNGCKFCYKDNKNTEPTNMTLETFKTILSKFPKTLTQIAFGITGVKTNPDFIEILKYTKEQGIMPNFTLSGIDLDDNMAKEIVKYIGACAVSVYDTDKEICYNTIKKFSDLGLKQVNIHCTVMQENIPFIYEVLEDIQTDERLKNLNAIVFLKLKPKGRAKGIFNNANSLEYNKLFDYCITNKIRFGADSCSAPDFENYLIKSNCDNKEQLLQMVESCESFGLFSSYIDVYGKYYPCSFASGEGEWDIGLDVLNCNDFIIDIWNNEKLNKYRNESLNTCYNSGCRKCLIFKEINP